MVEKLVTIASYSTAPEADLARYALEAEGIRCYLADVNVIQMNWFLGNALGFIKLQVSSNDRESAIQILESLPKSSVHRRPPGKQDSNQCLSCGAAMGEDVDTCPDCGWSFQSDSQTGLND